jgi:WD40 repeat protein
MCTWKDFYLASGHEDGHILLWDLRSSRPLGTFSIHQDECRAISFSPDGKWLLSGKFAIQSRCSCKG